MYIITKTKRKPNRGKTRRYRAKLKAKNTARRARLFAWKAKKRRTTKKRANRN